ncbi:MAG: hypothetical protein P0107_01735 [Nitrosomonas sp.]|nr:hypothetical protein [Nitrosomonas sp.]
MQSVDAALCNAFGQRQVASIYSGLNQYYIVMEVPRQFSNSPEALDSIYLPVTATSEEATFASIGGTASGGSATAFGGAVNHGQDYDSLSAFARWSTGSASTSVSHSDGEPQPHFLSIFLRRAHSGRQPMRSKFGPAWLYLTVHGGIWPGTARVFGKQLVICRS